MDQFLDTCVIYLPISSHYLKFTVYQSSIFQLIMPQIMAIVTQKKNAAKVSGQTIMGKWKHLLCTSFLKNKFYMFSEKLACMHFLSVLLRISKLRLRELNSRAWRWI